MSKKTYYFILLAILVFSFFIRLRFISVPLERDEGEYAYLAQVIDRGGLPYRDAFDQKPPLVFYLYYLAFKLFGENVEGIRIFTSLYNLLSVFLIGELGRKCFNPAVGLFSALAFAVMSTQPGILGFTSNTEIFMLLFLVAGFYFCLLSLEKNNPLLVFLSGVLAGLGLLAKQQAFLNIVFILFIFLRHWRINREKISSWLVKLLLFSTGVLGVLSLVLLYFYSRQGLSALYQNIILFNLKYAGDPWRTFSLGVFWLYFRKIIYSDILFWLLALSTLFLRKKLEGKNLFLFWIWFILSFLGVSIGGYFRDHYFQQLLPSLSVLSGAGLYYLLLRLKQSRKVLFKELGLPLVAGLIFAFPFLANYPYWFKYTPVRISEDIYAGNIFGEARKIGEYLKSNTSPNDSVFILGSEPEIFFYAQRRSATKFIFMFPLYWDYALAPLWQKQCWEEVLANRPEYIIGINSPLSFGTHTDRYRTLVTETNKLLTAEYVLDGVLIRGKTWAKLFLGPQELNHLNLEVVRPPVELIICHRKEKGGKTNPFLERLKIIRLGFLSVNEYLDRGLGYQKQQQYALAIEEYKDALRVDPGSAGVYYYLGGAFYLKGSLEEAISAYQKCTELDPGYANAYYNLGVLYSQQKNTPEAVRMFKKYISLRPSDPRSSSLKNYLQENRDGSGNPKKNAP